MLQRNATGTNRNEPWLYLYIKKKMQQPFRLSVNSAQTGQDLGHELNNGKCCLCCVVVFILPYLKTFLQYTKRDRENLLSSRK